MNEKLNKTGIETPENIEELKRKIEERFAEILKPISDFAEKLKVEKE